MDRVNWREMLQLAPNMQAVDALMRDYVQSISQLLGALPEGCQRALTGELDIQAAAVELLHAELHFDGSEQAREFLHDVAHTFAAAAVRITLLHRMPAGPGI